MAGTLIISTLSDGTNSTSATNCIQGSAKAWVNFNGTGTIAIRASYNVSSLTDNGTGDYTVNFTNAIGNSNYSAAGQCAELLNDTGSYVRMVCPVNTNTGSHRIITTHTNASKGDMIYVGIQIFG